MQVASVSSTTAVSGPRSKLSSSSDTAALQKRLRDLTNALKEASTDSTLSAKAKQQKLQLLQAQIQAVQAQLEAIQRQKQQEQIQKQSEAPATQTTDSGSTASNTGGASGLGGVVDTYA